MILCLSRGEDRVCAWKCMNCVFVIVYQHLGLLNISWTFIDQLLFHEKWIFSLNSLGPIDWPSIIMCITLCTLYYNYAGVWVQCWEIILGDNHLEMTTETMPLPCNPRAQADVISASTCPQMIFTHLRVLSSTFLVICCRYLGNPNREAVLLEKQDNKDLKEEDHTHSNSEHDGVAQRRQLSYFAFF